jgi:hypothetical protein
MMLASTSIAAVVALGACAPTQPAPQPGGAKLSSDIIPYDRPQFLTNRAPVLPPGKECDKMPKVLQALHLTAEKPLQLDSKHNTDGCKLTFQDAEITVTSSPASFESYWAGTIPERAPGAPTGMANGQVSSLQRGVLLGKYYDVLFATDVNLPNGSAVCHLAVDTGSRQPLLVSADLRSPANQDPTVTLTRRIPLAEVTSKYCPLSTAFAEKIMPILDPQGGSRAG